jgi:hypothetical protein
MSDLQKILFIIKQNGIRWAEQLPEHGGNEKCVHNFGWKV